MARERPPPSIRRANYGQGTYDIDAPDYLLSPEAMVAHLRRTLAGPDYKPPLLPAIATELLKLTRQPEVSVSQVRQLLERDPLLAAKVLQLAQSALYSPGVVVRSLHEAIARLGLNTIGDLFLQTVLSMRVFRAEGYAAPMASIMRHSTLTAHVARIACRMTSIPDEYAFMCGLLHDAGMAAGLLILSGAGAGRGGRGAEEHAAPKFDDVATSLYAVHEEASAILADTWQLHPDIGVVLGNHHHVLIGTRVHPLAAAVCVSDWIASEVGAGLSGESDPDHAQFAAQSLGFTRAALDDLTCRAREIVELL